MSTNPLPIEPYLELMGAYERKIYDAGREAGLKEAFFKLRAAGYVDAENVLKRAMESLREEEKGVNE